MDGDFLVGEWLVSPALNQISGHGHSARVEPKAMQVLVYLARNPGVVSKEQLIGAVWPDVFVSEDVLPGCISALRKAFHDSARRPRVIETIHKSGYRLLPAVYEANGRGGGDPQASSVGARGLKMPGLAVSAATVAALVISVLVWVGWRGRYESVAVLPFVNAENNPDLQYLSDGIAEEVINDLSHVKGLRVMAWTTVSRYRQGQGDPRDAGRELGVKAVLSARLLRHGEHIVLRTELVDVSSGSQLWGQQYEAAMAQTVGLQEQLSRDIAANLRVRLTGAEEQRLRNRHNPAPAAYQLYLQGRFYWNKRTRQNLEQAIHYFQQAIQLDPNYAAAYAGLADCYNLLDDWGETPPRDSFPQARAAAEKALQLDDSLAEAHTSLAMVRASYDWDWRGAEQEFQRALALNPNYATAHQWYALFLASQLRFAEAEAEIKRAQQLDPLSPIINMGVAEVYDWERREDAALAQYQKTVALDPSFVGGWDNLGSMYERMQQYPEALAAWNRQWELLGEAKVGNRLETAYRRAGYMALVREWLAYDLEQRQSGHYRDAVNMAGQYARLGDAESALRWLQKGYEEHSSGMQYLAVSPAFDTLRSNPQFQYWIRVLGLPRAEQATGAKRGARGPRTSGADRGSSTE